MTDVTPPSVPQPAPSAPAAGGVLRPVGPRKILEIQLVPALDGVPVRIETYPGERYELKDPRTGRAPRQVRVWRVANDLWIALDTAPVVDASVARPDLVLGHYFDPTFVASPADSLVGLDEGGLLRSYMLVVPEPSTAQAVTHRELSTLASVSTQILEFPRLEVQAAGTFPVLIPGLLAGALAAAAGGGGGGGSSSGGGGGSGGGGDGSAGPGTPGLPTLAAPEAAGGLSRQEAADGTVLAIGLPANAAVGDVVTTLLGRPDGSTLTLSTTLSSVDVATGSITQPIGASALVGADGSWTVRTSVARGGTAGSTATLSFSVDSTVPAPPPRITVPEARDGLSAAEASDGTAVVVQLPTGLVAGDRLDLVLRRPGASSLTRSVLLGATDLAAGQVSVTLGDAELKLNGGFLDGAWSVAATFVDPSGNVSEAATADFDLDTRLVLQGTVAAGPVTGGLAVQAFDVQGKPLGSGTVGTGGTWRLELAGLGAYRGPVLVKVTDANGSGANYVDEVTAAPRSLDTTLRAIDVVAESSPRYSTTPTGATVFTVDVNPLTELAARRLVGSGDQPPADVAAIEAANRGVASAFGLTGVDIIGGAVPTNSAAFDASDGLSAAERVGLVLAKLSGVERLQGGSLAESLSLLQAGLTGQAASLALSPAAAAWVDQGRDLALQALQAAASNAERTFLLDTPLNRLLLGGIVVTRQEVAADGRLIVFGQALGATSVRITFPDGTIQSVTAAADGSFVATSAKAQASLGTPLLLGGEDALRQPVNIAVPGSPTIQAGNGRVIAGTGTPGSEVEVSDSAGRSLGTVTVDPLGGWVLTPASPLAADTALQAVARDASGNVSAPTRGRVELSDTGLQVPEAGDAFVNAAELADGGLAWVAWLPTNARAGSRLDIVVMRPDGSTKSMQLTLTGADIAAGSVSQALPDSDFPADGRYRVSASVTSAGGSTSATAEREFTVDRSAPAAATLETVGAQLVSGRAEPGSTVTVRGSDGRVIGTAGPVGPDGNWSIRPDPALLDAAQLEVTTRDAAGNTGAAVRGQVLASAVRIYGTLDDLAPGLGLVEDGGATNDASPLLTGSAGRTLLAGQVMAIYRKAASGSFVRVGEASVSGTGWSFQDGNGPAGSQTAPLADGSYAYQARIEAGGSPVAGLEPSAEFDLTVLSVAPAAARVTLPEAQGADSHISASERTSGGGVPVVVTLPAGLRPGDAITLELTLPDGSVRRVGTNLSEGQLASGNTSLLVPGELLDLDGDWTLTTTFTSGVTGLTSPPARSAFTLDTTSPAAPTGSLDATSDTGVAGDGVTRDATPGFAGRAEPGNTVRLTVVQANGETATFTVLAGADGSWAVDTGALRPDGSNAAMPALADGSRSVTVQTRDAAGNDSPVVPIALMVDTTVAPPVIAPTNGFQSVSGSGEPGATVTLTQGSGIVGTARVAADGSWRIALLAPLADGTVLSATQLDVAGNTSAADTEPVNAAVPLILPTNGRGLAGTGRAGDTLVLSAGGTTLGTVLIDAEGKWSFTPASALANGTVVTAVDQQNGLSDSETVDAQPPGAPAAQLDPASDSGTLGDGRTSDATPTLRGSGASPGDTIAVRMPVTEELLSTRVAADGSWSVTPSLAVPHGSSGSVRVSATDSAGNTSAETLVALTIDTQASAPTLALDAASDSGSVGDGLTQDTTPAFKGTAEPGSSVRLVLALDAQRSVTYTVQADAQSGAWSLDTATARPDGRTLPVEPLADGPHPVAVTATDPAGNASTAASLALVVDATALAPAIAPTNGFAAVSGTGEPGAVLTLRSPAGVLGTTLVAADGTWRVTLAAAQPDGTVLSATQLDAAGNTSAPDSETVNANVPFIRPTNGQLLAGTARPGNTVVLTTSTGTALGSVVAGADGTWSLTPATPLVNGTSVTATNQQSGLSSSETVDAQPPASPQARLDPASDSGTLGDGRTNVTTPTLSGAGATPGDTITARMPATGELLTTQVAADGSWSLRPTVALPHGTSGNATLTATDPAGNTSPASTVALAIDTTSPAAPTGSLDATSDTGVAGDRKTRIRTPVLSGTAESGVTVEVTLAGRSYTTVASNGRWSLSIPASDALPDGIYRPTARAVDDTGNATTASLATLEIDGTPPGVPIVVLDPASDTGRPGDNRTRDTTPTIRGNSEPGATVLLTLNGKTYAPAPDALGAWTFTVPDADALVDAAYVTQVSVTDPAGNRLVAEGVRFTVDTTAPALPRGGLDAASDSGVVGDNRTATRAPTLSGTAESGSTVDVTLIGAGRTLVLSTQTDGTGNWKVSVPQADSLANGTYSVGLKSTDGAGNVSSGVGTPFEIFGVTLAAPTIVQVDDDVNVTGRIEANATTDDARPTLRISAPSGSTVRVFDGSALLGTALETSTGNFTFTPETALAEGPHTLTALAVDAAGNSSPASTAFTFIVDAIPPAPPVIQVNGPEVVSGTAELASGETLLLRIGGATFDLSTPSGPWQLDLRTATPASGSLNLADAPFVARAEVRDAPGNVAMAVRGTERDDLITLLADDIARLIAGTQTVQGDAGFDTVALGSAGAVLNLALIDDTAIQGVERMAIGRNTLIVTASDVRALGGTELVVTGEAGGLVRLQGSNWSAAGEVAADGVTYAVYTAEGVSVRIQAGLDSTVNASPLGLHTGAAAHSLVWDPAAPPVPSSTPPGLLRWGDLLASPWASEQAPWRDAASQQDETPVATGADGSSSAAPHAVVRLDDLLHVGPGMPPAPHRALPVPGDPGGGASLGSSADTFTLRHVAWPWPGDDVLPS